MSGPTFQTTLLHGRQAYVLENDKIRFSALQGGGHLAEIRLLVDDPLLGINPFYVPRYQTIEPFVYEPAKHDELYGGGPHTRLSSGYMGHLLCFPSFGPPSADEAASGLGVHGEAVEVPWLITKSPEISDEAIAFHYAADLPNTQYRVERTITLRTGEAVVHVEEWFENLASFDRPFNRDQHATFGAPFVSSGKTMLDLSGGQGVVMPRRTAGGRMKDNGAIQWPNAEGPDGQPVSLRPFHDVVGSGTYCAITTDDSRPTNYFTMYNPDHRLLVGYLFPTEDSPWIVDWQEHMSNKRTPANGVMIARGIEWGTSPVDEGLRRSVERGSMFGKPTFRWIGARQRVKSEFTLFLTEIPADFAGVADVQSLDGQIVLYEQGSERTITVPHRAAA